MFREIFRVKSGIPNSGTPAHFVLRSLPNSGRKTSRAMTRRAYQTGNSRDPEAQRGPLAFGTQFADLFFFRFWRTLVRLAGRGDNSA